MKKFIIILVYILLSKNLCAHLFVHKEQYINEYINNDTLSICIDSIYKNELGIEKTDISNYKNGKLWKHRAIIVSYPNTIIGKIRHVICLTANDKGEIDLSTDESIRMIDLIVKYFSEKFSSEKEISIDCHPVHFGGLTVDIEIARKYEELNKKKNASYGDAFIKSTIGKKLNKTISAYGFHLQDCGTEKESRMSRKDFLKRTKYKGDINQLPQLIIQPTWMTLYISKE